MLSTLLVVGVLSHLWCAARLVGIAHHSFYSVSAFIWAPLVSGSSVLPSSSYLDIGRTHSITRHRAYTSVTRHRAYTSVTRHRMHTV